MLDCQFGYADLPQLDTFARWAVAGNEAGRLHLPASAFVWLTRQPEQFLFFVADGTSQDPPVFLYVEEQGHFDRVTDSFWAAVEHELGLLEERARKLPGDDPQWQEWRRQKESR
jgi:hypothetical protein